MRKILPCITTTSGSKWKEKIKTTQLKEVAIFITCLKNRKEFYNLLKKNNYIKKIPFVHLRGDMEIKELDFFVNQYKTKIFNLHSKTEHPILYDYSKYKDIIYIENHSVLKEKELKKYAGICLDVSHLENDRKLHPDRFKKNQVIIKKYKIGCNHISAIKKEKRIDRTKKPRIDYHFLENLSELDYLKNYPLNYFSNMIALELENSLEEQLRIKKYIQKILWRL